jgi:hypothetical protein
MFASVTNLAGRAPRFSPASWIRASGAMAAMFERGQSARTLVVGGSRQPL